MRGLKALSGAGSDVLAPGAGEQPSPVYPGLLGTIKEGDPAGVAGRLAWQDSCPALSSSGVRVYPENTETEEIGLELQLGQKC